MRGFDLQGWVREFHEAFGLPAPRFTVPLTPEEMANSRTTRGVGGGVGGGFGGYEAGLITEKVTDRLDKRRCEI